jgi:hypothetical protein
MSAGKVFGFEKGSASFKRFETFYAKTQDSINNARSKDQDRYLTPHKLNTRESVTKNGRAALTLAYGKDSKVEYTLTQLEAMAKAVEAKQGQYQPVKGGVGVTVAHLFDASLKVDQQRARDIRNATLFKIGGNLLQFRVSASGESAGAPSHYLVRVRLEELEELITTNRTPSYLASASQAAAGRVSLDCTCARYRFWYHYLASIGKFDLAPHEGVFPKIRNPHLKGCVCKHILKTLMVMQTSPVRSRIAIVMEQAAKTQGLLPDKARLINAKDRAKLETAGNIGVDQAFKDFRAANKAFAAHKAKPEVKAKADKLREDQMESVKKRAEVDRQKRVAAEAVGAAQKRDMVLMLSDMKELAKMKGIPFADMLKNRPNSDRLITIAREEKLI